MTCDFVALLTCLQNWWFDWKSESCTEFERCLQKRNRCFINSYSIAPVFQRSTCPEQHDICRCKNLSFQRPTLPKSLRWRDRASKVSRLWSSCRVSRFQYHSPSYFYMPTQQKEFSTYCLEFQPYSSRIRDWWGFHKTTKSTSSDYIPDMAL